MKRFLPTFAVLLVGCVPPAGPTPPAIDPAPPPATESVPADWPSVTDKPYFVEQRFVVACAQPNDLAETRPTQESPGGKHGPHAVTAIVVRVDPVGREAFLARTPVPVGTVVVKEKLADHNKTAVGTMTKREPGYDPENGDWEYGYRELRADAPPPSGDKLDSCIACHRIARGKDYLYRPYLPK